MLAWAELGRDNFERVVESLVIRAVGQDSPGLVARAVDGRGGDQGVDIEVRERATMRLVRILQLKYFPEGFSGFARGRRGQIVDSFRTAMHHHQPDEWTLVVPRNLTPAEADFLQALPGSNAVRVSSWGPAELDGMLAKHPELADYAQRTPMRAALELAGRGNATLATTDDLVAETQALRRRAEGWSSYWRPVLSRDNGRDTITYAALREDSAEREPLNFQFQMDWADHPELRAAFTEAVDYGSIDRLELPPEVVQHMRRSGPEWFEGTSGPGTLILGPVEDSYQRGRITCTDQSGRRLATRNAVQKKVASGPKGGRVMVAVDDGITLTIQLAYGQEGGSLRMTSDLAGLTGAAAHRQLQFLEAMTRSHVVRLKFDTFDSEFTINGASRPPAADIVAFAADLAVIEERGRTSFSWPKGYAPSVVERVWVRFLRLILAGNTVAVPLVREVSLRVNSRDDEVEALVHSGGPVAFPLTDWSLTVLGEELTVGDVMCFHPNLRAVDAEQAFYDLRRGCRIPFAPADDSPFVMWLPEVTGSVEPGPLVPWGLPGVPELSADASAG